jgi:hypothetical protein
LHRSSSREFFVHEELVKIATAKFERVSRVRFDPVGKLLPDVLEGVVTPAVLFSNVRIGRSEMRLAAVIVPTLIHDGFEEPPCPIGVEQALREHLPVTLDKFEDRRALL